MGISEDQSLKDRVKEWFLERSIVNQFGSKEECGMFVIALEKDLQLAKGVIGTARVEIMKSDQPAKVMSVIQAYENP